MKKRLLSFCFAGLISVAVAHSALAADKLFDPGRNAAADLKSAEAQAQAQHKNILMDVGGNWCPWCLLLDRTLMENAQLHQDLEQNYRRKAGC
jgi:thioredoxin-related protein